MAERWRAPLQRTPPPHLFHQQGQGFAQLEPVEGGR
jgi:hypothetical protein